MVAAEDGSSWIYKNKDHGKRTRGLESLHFKFLTQFARYDERVRQLGSELALGYR